MTKSCSFDVEGLVWKSSTQVPFTSEESKTLLESFDLIEKNYDEESVEKLPATAQLPSRSPTKTVLVTWVLLNVGEVPFPTISRFSRLILLAKHRQSNKYGGRTFEEACKAQRIERPGLGFWVLSCLCLSAPMRYRANIYAARRRAELCGDKCPSYVDTLVREWSTYNLMVGTLSWL